MRFRAALIMVTALTAAACGGNMSSPMSSPMAPTSASTITGTWIGSASDSSGSMMGDGSSGSMMGSTTWAITQTGNTFTGTMQVGGHDGGTMTVSGMINGTTGSFTMSRSGGSMMSGACSATATGTFDMDDMMTQLHATYAGVNSCSGPFDHGLMTMAHR